MNKKFANAVLVCGLSVLGLQCAHAQTLTASALPDVVSGNARAGAPFTVQVTNQGPNEAFGVVVRFSIPKGLKVAVPGTCMALSKSSLQCMLGYIAPGSSADLDLTVSSTKGGNYSMSFSVVCTAEACDASDLAVPILLN
jgi:hypothetical protein